MQLDELCCCEHGNVRGFMFTFAWYTLVNYNAGAAGPGQVANAERSRTCVVLGYEPHTFHSIERVSVVVIYHALAGSLNYLTRRYVQHGQDK